MLSGVDAADAVTGAGVGHSALVALEDARRFGTRTSGEPAFDGVDAMLSREERLDDARLPTLESLSAPIATAAESERGVKLASR